MEESPKNEMESLNLEAMDVNELEKRLELTIAGGETTEAWATCCVDGGGSCPNLQSCD